MKFYVVSGERYEWYGDSFSYTIQNFETIRKIFEKELSAFLRSEGSTWEDYKYDAPVSTYEEWIDYLVNEEHEFGDLVKWEEATFDDKLFD